MSTKIQQLSQAKAAFQLECTIANQQLESFLRIAIAEVECLRSKLVEINHLQTEVHKWQFELQSKENPLRLRAHNSTP